MRNALWRVGIAKRSTTPSSVMRPISLLANPVNHMAPSGPEAMPTGTMPGTGNSRTSPKGVMRPMSLARTSANTVAMVRAGAPCVPLVRPTPGLSPYGTQLAAGTPRSRRELLARYGAGNFGVAFNPDGRHLANSKVDRTVRVWSVSTTWRIAKSRAASNGTASGSPPTRRHASRSRRPGVHAPGEASSPQAALAEDYVAEFGVGEMRRGHCPVRLCLAFRRRRRLPASLRTSAAAAGPCARGCTSAPSLPSCSPRDWRSHECRARRDGPDCRPTSHAPRQPP